MESTNHQSWPQAAQVRFIQRRIAKAWRSFYCRKQRKQGRVLVRVAWPSALSGGTPEVVGSFTLPPWQQRLPMKYSLRHKEYFLEVWMTVTDLFQVILRDTEYIYPPGFQKSLYHTENRQPCLLPVSSDLQYRCMLQFHARITRRTPSLIFAAAASVIPRQGKLLEDAHFLEGNMLGIADGVGGWRGLGVDSGKFATELIQACRRQSLQSWSLVHTPLSDASTSSLLPVAETALQSVDFCGSCTLLLCSLHCETLEVLNLGDSKAVLVRFIADRPTIIMRTTSMQHTFNTPFQVSKPLSRSQQMHLLRNCPHDKVKSLSKTLAHLINDGFNHADVYHTRVRAGDLLLVGSDGLWDNLYESEVVEMLRPGVSCEHFARLLTRKAYERSVSQVRTPFEDEAVATYGESAWKGGKQDDITVVAAWIRDLTR